jgi:hypothetical protein
MSVTDGSHFEEQMERELSAPNRLAHRQATAHATAPTVRFVGTEGGRIADLHSEIDHEEVHKRLDRLARLKEAQRIPIANASNDGRIDPIELSLANLSVNECHEKAMEHLDTALAYIARGAANAGQPYHRNFFFDIGRRLYDVRNRGFVKDAPTTSAPQPTHA